MENSPSVARAAHNLLAQSLALRAEQNLLIFADRNALAVADAITASAQEMGIHATTIYAPRAIQDAFTTHEVLPLTVEAALREADAIVSCLSDRPAHFAYRARVLREGWRRRTKLAHMPGMTLDLLALADTDFERIAEQGLLLALAFVLGREIEVQTTQMDGARCRLAAELRGWEFPPGISDGSIPEGSWANLPPGEAFVVPFHARGQVVINGSLPGYVLGREEELVLTFEGGRLRSISPEESPAGRHLRTSQLDYAQQMGDSNGGNLAEIGIGLNPAIRSLCGVELVDEKKAGSAHIALGNSALLGGTVDSVIHCDLVIEEPTITVDGKPILTRGQWDLRPEDWLLDHRRVTPPDGWWESMRAVRSSGSRAERENGLLYRLWSSRSGRRSRLPVGRDGTARLAQKLYGLLHEKGIHLPREALLVQAAQAALPESELPGLLWVLHRFDLIRITDGGEEG